MRKRIFASSACLLATASLATGTASAANTVGASQWQSSQNTAGSGSVSSDSEQFNGVTIVQDEKKRNVARVTQSNFSRKVQIGNSTSSTTNQTSRVSISQADGDNSARVRQRNSSGTMQQACRVSGGPELDISHSKSIEIVHSTSTSKRNSTIVHQRNIYISVQRSC